MLTQCYYQSRPHSDLSIAPHPQMLFKAISFLIQDPGSHMACHVPFVLFMLECFSVLLRLPDIDSFEESRPAVRPNDSQLGFVFLVPSSY